MDFILFIISSYRIICSVTKTCHLLFRGKKGMKKDLLIHKPRGFYCGSNYANTENLVNGINSLVLRVNEICDLFIATQNTKNSTLSTGTSIRD